jgi:hypothetical protein
MASESGNTPTNGYDEFLEAWRKAAADTEQRWNDFFNDVMGTEAFAQMLARSMDGYLAMQSTFARGFEPVLRAMTIPTQTDLNQLAERVTQLEQKVDLLAAMLGAAPVAPAVTPETNGKRRRGRKRESSAPRT